ncbi:hypothetical protein B9Z19DRAFT_388306 [Tuber borchii]|uniref:Uncharacterized protein n=1 Tax=Tuber borchii TaxID=42251 RepID=A0A2T7A493_TUBBO|nr:hypothetical protein B9Z19DRAFT_388306 [Tuber borchii]
MMAQKSHRVPRSRVKINHRSPLLTAFLSSHPLTAPSSPSPAPPTSSTAATIQATSQPPSLSSTLSTAILSARCLRFCVPSSTHSPNSPPLPFNSCTIFLMSGIAPATPTPCARSLAIPRFAFPVLHIPFRHQTLSQPVIACLTNLRSSLRPSAISPGSYPGAYNGPKQLPQRPNGLGWRRSLVVRAQFTFRHVIGGGVDSLLRSWLRTCASKSRILTIRLQRWQFVVRPPQVSSWWVRPERRSSAWSLADS